MAYAKNDDYIEVPERIAEFRTKYPEGGLQPWDKTKPYEIVELGGVTHIIVVAAAYRTPDDPIPGVGMAQEVFPGKTPYTKGSELMNAETSAWGRAIVAALAADTKRGIASAEEVRNRKAEQSAPAPPTEDEVLQDRLRKLCQSKGIKDPELVQAKFVELGGAGRFSAETDVKLLTALIDAFKGA